MKKVLALLLAAVLAVSALAGCSSSSKEETTKAAETEAAKTEAAETEAEKTEAAETEAAETEAPASSDGKVKIKILRVQYNLQQVDDAQVDKVAAEINKLLDAKGSNVEVEIKEYIGSEYFDKTNLALVNGEMQMFWNAHWVSTISTNDIWRSNGAYDLTDLLPGTDLYNAMPEGVWKASEYEGRILFVPVYKECYEGYDLKVRKNLADELGFDYTAVNEAKPGYDKFVALEDIIAQAAEVVDYPYLAEQNFTKFYIDYFDAFGGASGLLCVDREKNEVVNAVDTDMYRDFCKLMAQWAEKGYINENLQTNNSPSGLNTSDMWGVGIWPCVPGGEKVNAEGRDQQPLDIIHEFTGHYIASMTTLGSAYTVAQSCSEEQAKACVEFLGYIFTDKEIADLWTYGIQGEDYELDEEGKVKRTENARFNHSPWESTSVVPLTLLSGEPDNKVEEYAQWNEEANTSCAAGFRFDATPVEAQWSACQNLNAEYGALLEVGVFPEEDVDATIDEYLERLDEAGYQDVLAEAQRQYNEWK